MVTDQPVSKDRRSPIALAPQSSSENFRTSVKTSRTGWTRAVVISELAVWAGIAKVSARKKSASPKLSLCIAAAADASLSWCGAGRGPCRNSSIPGAAGGGAVGPSGIKGAGRMVQVPVQSSDPASMVCSYPSLHVKQQVTSFAGHGHALSFGDLQVAQCAPT